VTITNIGVDSEALCMPVICQVMSMFTISMRNAYTCPLHYDPLSCPALTFTIQAQGFYAIQFYVAGRWSLTGGYSISTGKRSRKER
jgi:hypothetical protein